MSKKQLSIPLFLVIFVAIVLRFYNFTEIPFTHDEFSTILRLNYENFTDLIEHGVKELDNHPGGHQVFNYFYTKWFGITQGGVKFINLLFGVFSVFVIYLLGKNWFNRTAGLFASAMFATLQYAIIQSQIARMYGFGILFVLLSAWFLYRFIINDKKAIVNLLGFTLMASAATYSHYFSFMLAGILGLLGLVYAKGKKRLYVIISGVVIVLLFLPHAHVLIYQLSKGGIEDWLGSFSYAFFGDYFMYVFNRSWLVISCVALILLVIIQLKPTKKEYHLRWIAFLLFILPIVIGSLYSMFVSNLLHAKVLYYSFPFGLLFLSSFIREQKAKVELGLVIILLLVNSLTLIYGRKHYELFFTHRYGLVAESSQDWTKEIPKKEVTLFKVSYQPADEYYYHKNGLDLPVTIYGDSITSVKEVDSLISHLDTEYLFFGTAVVNDPSYLAIAKHYYPQVVKFKYGVASQAYLLKRGESNLSEIECVFFEDKQIFAQRKPENIRRDGNSDSIYLDWSVVKEEFALTQTFALDSISFSQNNIVEFSIEAFREDSIGGAMLVCQIEKNGKVVDWRASNFDDFLAYKEEGTVLFSVKLPDIRYPKGSDLKFYVWNPKKSKYRLRTMEIKVRAGNPFIYAGTRDIPKDLSKYCIN